MVTEPVKSADRHIRHSDRWWITSSFLAVVAIVLASVGLGMSSGRRSSTTLASAPTTTGASTSSLALVDLPDSPNPSAVNVRVTHTGAQPVFSIDKVSVPAGLVTFNLINNGKALYEVLLYEPGVLPDTLVAGSIQRVDESKSVGEVSDTPGRTVASTTLDLEPGKYVLLCNSPSHFGLGMRIDFTVTARTTPTTAAPLDIGVSLAVVATTAPVPPVPVSSSTGP